MAFRDVTEDASAPLEDPVTTQSVDRRIPLLEDVHRLALAARARGEAYVDVEVMGYGRQWAPFITAFGYRAEVVARMRERKVAVGSSVDSGAISRLIIRFAVVDVFAAYKREFLRRTLPRSIVPANRRRRRLRHVTIR